MITFSRARLAFLLILAISIILACNFVPPRGLQSTPALETPFTPTETILTPTNGVTPAGSPTATSTPQPEPTGLPTNTQEIPPATATLTPPEPTQPALPELSDLRLVYIKEGNVWLWTQPGSGVALTTSGQALEVKISDDGLIVAYTRAVDEFHTELWTVQTDGTEESPLVTVEDLAAMGEAVQDPNARAIVPYHFVWIPGTHTLAFNTRQVFEGPGLVLLDDMRLVNADTFEQSTLLPPGSGGEFTYAPNGNQAAIITPTKISLINADGSQRRDGVLEYESVITYSEYEFYARPVWAADSASLRVAIPPPDPLAQPTQATTLWQIPTDGSPASQLGSVIAAPFFGAPVVFSPDLAYIIYLRETGEPAQNIRELHIASPDGSGDIIYHTAPLVQFEGWAASENRFVFAFGENRELQLGQVGEGFIPLSPDPAGIFNLRWIDPQRYLHLKENAGMIELRLSGLDGTGLLLDTVENAPPSYDFSR